MTHSILEFIRKQKVAYSIIPGHVLEVGSQDVNGSARTVFKDAASYVGIDMEAGKGVDVVGNAEDLENVLAKNRQRMEFDSIVCLECLEHAVRPWVIVNQMKFALNSGGYLWISTPTFGFPLHRYPIDCYRYGEDAFRSWMFADMKLLALETVEDEFGFPIIAAVGIKP